MNFKIDLPKAADWNASENYAENLREAKVAGITGCVPVGTPTVLAENAGAVTEVLPGGNILSVSDDRHDLFLNGKAAGSLGAPLAAILPQGNNEALLFTSNGVEVFADGKLQEGAPGLDSVTVSVSENTETISEAVELPKLTGTYPRPYGVLTETDSDAAAKAITDVLKSFEARAQATGLWIYPTRIAWRMLDSDERVIIQSPPIAAGTMPKFLDMTFAATHSESTLDVTNSAILQTDIYELRVQIKASASAFWQNRVAAIEIIAWSASAALTGVNSNFVQKNSAESTLTLSATLSEPDHDSAEPRLLARIKFPLVSGANLRLNRLDEKPCEYLYSDDCNVIFPSALCTAGTITAYGLADKPGMLAVASGNDPLLIRATRRICMSKILRITPPAGTAGGWNYGRHHLLAFTIDGIYAVSIDSTMRTISSSRLAPLGIERADAVTVSPEALYVASISGTLLRLKGTRIEPLKVPITPKAVCRNILNGELWVAPEMGCPIVLNDSGGVCLRTDITVSRFIEPAMAVDSAGRLRNIAEEDTSTETYVEWRRREICEVREQMRKALWVLDAERAFDFTLQILADSGGAPQRLLELTANGPINAPIAASFQAPRRAFYTAKLRGTLRNPSRLLQVTLTR